MGDQVQNIIPWFDYYFYQFKISCICHVSCVYCLSPGASSHRNYLILQSYLDVVTLVAHEDWSTSSYPWSSSNRCTLLTSLPAFILSPMTRSPELFKPPPSIMVPQSMHQKASTLPTMRSTTCPPVNLNEIPFPLADYLG